MGAQNVAKVFAHWRCLSHRDARVLTFMALISLDADHPPVYFGGWEAVADAVGLDSAGKRVSAQEVFRQSVASLVKKGALVSSGQARMRVRAEYALTLDPAITFRPSGKGRDIVWDKVKRPSSPNETLPQVPQQNVAPDPNETLPQVPQQNVGTSPNKTLPPMRTEEPLGGIQEDPDRGIPLRQAISLTNAGPTKPPPQNLPIEEERQRQMLALQKLMEGETAS